MYMMGGSPQFINLRIFLQKSREIRRRDTMIMKLIKKSKLNTQITAAEFAILVKIKYYPLSIGTTGVLEAGAPLKLNNNC